MKRVNYSLMNFLNAINTITTNHSLFRKIPIDKLHIQVSMKLFLHRLKISDEIWLKIQIRTPPKNDIYKLEWKSVYSKSWFDLDFDCIENNFKKRELELYKRNFRHYVAEKSDSKALIFPLPIGHSNKPIPIELHMNALH